MRTDGPHPRLLLQRRRRQVSSLPLYARNRTGDKTDLRRDHQDRTRRGVVLCREGELARSARARAAHDRAPAERLLPERTTTHRDDAANGPLVLGCALDLFDLVVDGRHPAILRGRRGDRHGRLRRREAGRAARLRLRRRRRQRGRRGGESRTGSTLRPGREDERARRLGRRRGWKMGLGSRASKGGQRGWPAGWKELGRPGGGFSLREAEGRETRGAGGGVSSREGGSVLV